MDHSKEFSVQEMGLGFAFTIFAKGATSIEQIEEVFTLQAIIFTVDSTSVEVIELDKRKCNESDPDYDKIQSVLEQRGKDYGVGYAICVTGLQYARLKGSFESVKA